MEPQSPEHDWIAPLIEELKLPRKKSTTFRPETLWARLKEHDVPERVRQAVVRLNREMNDAVLEYVEYLPPQTSVLRVAYRERGRILAMEIVVREDGPKVVFYQQKSYGVLLRYLYGRYRSRSSVALSRRFQPEQLAHTDIQEWFSFLLSGFKRLPVPDKEAREGRPRGSRLTEVL